MNSTAKLCAICCFLFTTTYAQPYHSYNGTYTNPALLVELGGSVGGINCLTDLGGGPGPGKKFIKDINWSNTQLCSSIYTSFTYNEVFGLRLETSFGKVKAFDSVLSKHKDNSHGRYYRNLNFQSNITEYAAIAEFHPLLLKNYDDKEPPHLSPYLLAGVAKFTFNPQAYFKGQWVDLQPLHLEGQGFSEYESRGNYRLSAISYPVGLGLRYELGPLFFARFEAVYRITNTDYLDDVSQEKYIDPATFSRHLTPRQATMATQLYSRS
ncbi:MAG: hypothetical protein EOO61_14610 [Hymenobacter sp.]|nr:MAG: hypothetical protein EOO61_14610 [Hymenobacter sp.]